MKRHNGFVLRDKARIPEPLKRNPLISKPKKPVTPYVTGLIESTDQRRRELLGEIEPKMLGEDLLNMLHVAGDRTVKGIAKDLHLRPSMALVIVEYLKDKNLVETWKDKRKNLCVGGL